MLNQRLRFFLLLFIGGLGACATPGAPPLMTTGSQTTPLLPDCQNVKPTVVNPKFVTDYYLTTSGSALAEGSIAGKRQALRQNASGIGAIWSAALPEPITISGDQLITRSKAPQPFCVLIYSPRDSVRRALDRTYQELRQFEYHITKSGQQDSLYQTAFKRHGHRAADWYDRISSSISPLDENRTALYVLREVFISRAGSDFIQAYSAGANEAWIMARVKELAR